MVLTIRVQIDAKLISGIYFCIYHFLLRLFLAIDVHYSPNIFHNIPDLLCFVVVNYQPFLLTSTVFLQPCKMWLNGPCKFPTAVITTAKQITAMLLGIWWSKLQPRWCHKNGGVNNLVEESTMNAIAQNNWSSLCRNCRGYGFPSRTTNIAQTFIWLCMICANASGHLQLQ